jgi:hypothetical protein
VSSPFKLFSPISHSQRVADDDTRNIQDHV